MNIESLLSSRVRSVEASGIRRVFDLGATLTDPIDLSIGQPDFPTPDLMKRAAIRAIDENKNGYTVTQGVKPLHEKICAHVSGDLGWTVNGESTGAIITSGTLGAICLAFMALLDQGDEVILPDPYFVAYPHLATLLGARPVLCDTYPDFRMTAERVEPLITGKTKAVLVNSPSNPAGAVLNRRQCAELLELCAARGVMLLSDEIYDEFVYDDARDPEAGKAPSPCRVPGAEETTLLIRGFGKTYGCTGWRMGYAAGPMTLISEMMKAQQYSFVCAPSMAQWACLEAFDVDVSETIARFQTRRDLVLERLGDVAEIAAPGGAFFIFPKVPERLGMTAQEFCETSIRNNVLVIPGNVFSARDTHFRISIAATEEKLNRGLDVLIGLLKGE